MPRVKKTVETKNGNGANLGFESKLWQVTDKLRNNMDAAEYLMNQPNTERWS